MQGVVDSSGKTPWVVGADRVWQRALVRDMGMYAVGCKRCYWRSALDVCSSRHEWEFGGIGSAAILSS